MATSEKELNFLIAVKTLRTVSGMRDSRFDEEFISDIEVGQKAYVYRMSPEAMFKAGLLFSHQSSIQNYSNILTQLIAIAGPQKDSEIKIILEREAAIKAQQTLAQQTLKRSSTVSVDRLGHDALAQRDLKASQFASEIESKRTVDEDQDMAAFHSALKAALNAHLTDTLKPTGSPEMKRRVEHGEEFKSRTRPDPGVYDSTRYVEKNPEQDRAIVFRRTERRIERAISEPDPDRLDRLAGRSRTLRFTKTSAVQDRSQSLERNPHKPSQGTAGGAKTLKKSVLAIEPVKFV